jgi:hypothetical protein
MKGLNVLELSLQHDAFHCEYKFFACPTVRHGNATGTGRVYVSERSIVEPLAKVRRGLSDGVRFCVKVNWLAMDDERDWTEGLFALERTVHSCDECAGGANRKDRIVVPVTE